MSHIINLSDPIYAQTLSETSELRKRLTQLNDFAYNEIKALANDILEILGEELNLDPCDKVSEELQLVRGFFNHQEITFNGITGGDQENPFDSTTFGTEKSLNFTLSREVGYCDYAVDCTIAYDDLFDAQRRTKLVIRLIKEIQNLS